MEFNVADLFEFVVDHVPDRLALVAGETRRTYAGLDKRANRLAHHLAARGVGPGEHVAVYAHNRAEWVEAFLALFKVRAVPINVNYRYLGDELRYVLQSSDTVAVLHEPEFAPALDALAPELPRVRLRIEIDDEYEDALASSSPARGFPARSPDDRYVVYTGGTTGLPKGVVWRHEDLFFAALGGGGYGEGPVARPEDLVERISPVETRSLILPPMMHAAAQWSACNVSYGFLGGGTVVLNTGRSFDARDVWRTVERERVNMIALVGDAMARPLVEALRAADPSFDTSSLAVIGSGGGILSPAVRDELRSLLPDVLLFDTYGASETGAGAIPADARDRASRFLLNEETTVLDAALQPVPPGSGVVGRLARRGHIPIGYYNDAAKTGATFVTAADGTRWVLPGDSATVEADGRITLLGRGSTCINTGGEKVYPEEVEAILKEHEDVFDALIVGVPDERLGERVGAVVQPRSGRAPSLESLQGHCRGRLAAYKAPRLLRLTVELPRSPAGKPDYVAARELLAGTRDS